MQRLKSLASLQGMVPAFTWRGLQMCVRMHIDVVSSVAWSDLEGLFQSLVLLGSLCVKMGGTYLLCV